MATPHLSSKLVIRPCEVCEALVLHDERELPERDASPDSRWTAFPHRIPGGAICIAGGKRRRAAAAQ